MTALWWTSRSPVRLVRRLVLAIALGCAFIGCQPQAAMAVDPMSAPLLIEHGLTATGASASTLMEVGDPAEQPWSLYLEASRTAGFDFTDQVGLVAELRRTPIAGAEADAAVFVLVHDGRVIGAWLSPGGSSSGVRSLAEHP